MSKFTPPTPSGVRWPAEWDQEEGWPSVNGRETGLKREVRLWGTLATHLNRDGLRAGQLIEELGGPPALELERTIEQLKEAILKCFEESGKRLTALETREARLWKSWCHTRGVSLAKICDELEIPGGNDLNRTIDRCHEAIFSYYKENGKSPSSKLPEFQRWDQWLRQQGSSLVNEIAQLGLPSLLTRDRDPELGQKKILEYHKKTGNRPTINTSPEFSQWNDWYRRQGSSLSLECDKLGLPTKVRLDRTMDQCDSEIWDYFNQIGIRPTQNTSGEFSRWNDWLRYQGSSLPGRCEELGIPAILNTGRTIEQCHREIQSYHKKVGGRPTTSSSKEFRNWDQWLRGQGSCLYKECDELGLSAKVNRNRTLKDLHREIRAFAKSHGGQRPSCYVGDFGNWNQWLRRQGSTLQTECNKLGLPPLRDYNRSFKLGRKEIRSFYKETGSRPTERTSKEWTNWNAWFRKQGTSLARECDKLGLK